MKPDLATRLARTRLAINSVRLPRLCRGFVIRERLAAQLADDNLPRLLIISAPLGFGKTQLMAHWCQKLTDSNLMVTWLDARLASSPADLISQAKNAGALDDPVGEDALPRTIFVDCCEAFAGSPLRHLVRTLVERLGPHDRLVLSGSCAIGVPPGESAKNLGREDLRFSDAESLTLLRHRLPHCSSAALAEAVQHCAGWPALLNLAVADLMRNPNGQDLSVRDGDGLTADFLVNAVFTSHSPDELAFFGDIAILDEVTAGSASAVTGEAGAAELLSRFAAHSPLFRTVPGDRLAFLPVARAILLRGQYESPKVVSGHRAAAKWYASNGDYAEATHHAVVGYDTDMAVELMEEFLLDIIAGGDVERAIEWVSALDVSRIAGNPAISLAASLGYMMMGDRLKAARISADLSRTEGLMLKALFAAVCDRPNEVSALLKAVAPVEALPPLLAACYSNLVHTEQLRTGAWAYHKRERQARPQDGAASGFLFTDCFALFLEAERRMVAGCSAEAVALLRPALASFEQRLGHMASLTLIVSTTLAAAHLQAGEIGEAERLFLGRQAAIERHPISLVWHLGLMTAARIAAHHGDDATSLDHLDRLEALAIERDIPRIRIHVLIEKARLHSRNRQQMLASLALTEIEQLKDRIRAESPMHLPRIELEECLGRAHLLRALGRANELRDMLAIALKLAHRLGRKLDLTEIELLGSDPRSAVPSSGKELSRDVVALRRRLAIDMPADPEAYARPAPVACKIHVGGQSAETIGLTAREVDVLEGLSRDLSNKSIAREHHLSAETVKWYVSNILKKLDARDRKHAVDRAQAFGLIKFSYAMPQLIAGAAVDRP